MKTNSVSAGRPEAWSIVCLAGKYADGYDEFKTSLTGFLGKLLNGDLSPKTFPRDFFPLPKPLFTPYNEQ